jgi:hypothetical protein
MTMRDWQSMKCLLMLAGSVTFALAHATAVQANQSASMPSRPELSQTIRYVLFLIVVLVGIFVISSFAFLRWSRRFRSHIFHEPSVPTPAEDAWAMHQLPASAEPQDPEQSTEESEEE